MNRLTLKALAIFSAGAIYSSTAFPVDAAPPTDAEGSVALPTSDETAATVMDAATNAPPEAALDEPENVIPSDDEAVPVDQTQANADDYTAPNTEEKPVATAADENAKTNDATDPFAPDMANNYDVNLNDLLSQSLQEGHPTPFQVATLLYSMALRNPRNSR